MKLRKANKSRYVDLSIILWGVILIDNVSVATIYNFEVYHV